MVLRLLNKREVDKAKSIDRKREVDEGTKLAKRVDGLRETVSKEEKNLKDFRDKTVSEVMSELKTLSDRKEYLKSDIEELERQHIIAKFPLDKEWLKIKEKQEIMSDLEEKLSSKSDEIRQKFDELETREQVLQVEEQRISDDRNRSKVHLANSVKTEEEAQYILNDAKKQAEGIISRAESKEKVADVREQNLTAREKRAFQQLEDNRSAKIDLMNRERALADAYATLERAKKYGKRQ